MRNSPLPCLLALVAPLLLSFTAAFAQETNKPNNARPADMTERLVQFLGRFPDSDANGDGTLTFDEFKAFQEKRLSGPEMKKRYAETLRKFPEADTDKDGTLSPEEARRFQAKRREMAEQRAARAPRKPPAPFPDVAYGDHEKQRFDLWPVPEATEPTPLVLFIHGGGFRGGDKSAVRPDTIETFHKVGIAYASLNYRLSDVGPYPIMMEDAARGLQTIRHRAAEWNLDPDRVVCYGGSAGAGISLWLAFHDDLADPDSDDPISRQSTRILAAATMNGQSTYDLHTFREWFAIPYLEAHDALLAFYDIKSQEDYETERVKALMRDASPIAHLSEDDQASVYMTYSRPNSEVTKETNQSVWVHHVRLGLKLQEAMNKRGLECIVTAPDMKAEDDSYGSLEAFLIEKARGNEE